MRKISLFIIYLLISFANCWDKNDPMCNNTNASCNYQFQRQVTNDFCQMIYYPINNSTICQEAYEEDAVRYNNVDLGNILFSPYYGDHRTVFELIFTDIRWKMMKVRFKEHSNKSNCMVKDFYINGEVLANESLRYDCPWHDASLEGHEVDFDYEYGHNDYETRRKYKFIVPYHENLAEDYEGIYFFTYIDYTNLHNLILTIKLAPTKFNVTQYEIEVHTDSYLVETKYVNVSNKTIDTVEYIYNTNGSSGTYSFHVKPISAYCEHKQYFCSTISTPKIYIPWKLSPVMIGVCSFSLVIIICLIVLCIWTLSWPYSKRVRLFRSNVLLVTFPTNNAHTTVATALSKFLKNVCDVNVILDHDDIPKTSLSSFDWLKTVLPNINYIVFLRSNDQLSSSRVIYHNSYRETVHLLNPQFIKYRKQECILSFPYSSDTTDKYKELCHVFNIFTFNKDFKAFLNFLNGRRKYEQLSKNKYYNDLLNAIKIIENELQEQKVVKNHFNIVVNEDLSNDEDSFVNQMKDEESVIEKILMCDSNFNNLLGLDNKQNEDNVSQCSDETEFDINEFNVCGPT